MANFRAGRVLIVWQPSSILQLELHLFVTPVLYEYD